MYHCKVSSTFLKTTLLYWFADHEITPRHVTNVTVSKVAKEQAGTAAARPDRSLTPFVHEQTLFEVTLRAFPSALTSFGC
jgi:hypothetical protein